MFALDVPGAIGVVGEDLESRTHPPFMIAVIIESMVHMGYQIWGGFYFLSPTRV